MLNWFKSSLGATVVSGMMASTAMAGCLNEEDMRRGVIVSFDNQ